MNFDKSGEIIFADSFNMRKASRRSAAEDVFRMRRMFSGTPATGFTGTGALLLRDVAVCMHACTHACMYGLPHPTTLAGVPIHHSLPGAPNTIYIDFDGMDISGTAWNAEFNVPVWNARPYDLDGNDNSFSAAEQVAMSRIWSRMAEDFASFNVDVTTEEPAVFGPRVGRYLVTFSRDKQNRALPFETSGGVAYMSVFGNSNYNL
jgi:hypothetical protein